MEKAKITFNANDTIAQLDDRIYGSFIEHLGRAVYDGIYEPGHPLADEQGFRKDVIEAVRDLHVPIIRYPGGNFVSGYNWEDGVGPKEKRPKRLELAWTSTETNEVGVHEFADWCEKVDSSVMMAVNLGTRGIDDARRLLEYCNHPSGTQLSDWRIENGRKAPFDITTWCLGNEMDGEWQMGSKTPYEYGRIAAETAKLLKLIDPRVQLVACGSSGHDAKLFGKWEREVLQHCYEYVDMVSLHQYYEPKRVGGDHRSYLTLADDLDAYIKEVAAICDEVGKSKGIKKQLGLSLDEWNVWYLSHDDHLEIKQWQIAPPLLEDKFTARDVVLFAGMLSTIINNGDRVKAACLAQLVNVIGPIKTEHGGRILLEGTYYPYKYACNYGRGTALKAKVDCAHYDCKYFKNAASLQVAGVLNKNEMYVQIVNRGETDQSVAVELQNIAVKGVLECKLMTSAENPMAINTFDAPNTVVPHDATAECKGGTVTLSLPRESVCMLRLKV